MNNGKQKPKQITIEQTDGKHWTAKFEGSVSRRDIKQINRVLTVEFARIQRRRTIDKLAKQSKPQTKIEKRVNDADQQVYIPGRK